MDVSRALRIVIAVRGMKQKELAEKVDVHPSYMSDIVTGRREPDPDVFIRLCKELDVSVPVITFLAADEDDLSSLNQESRERMTELLMEFLWEE